jgi:uncharacterized protein GlcG (DUF336 family)
MNFVGANYFQLERKIMKKITIAVTLFLTNFTTAQAQTTAQVPATPSGTRPAPQAPARGPNLALAIEAARASIETCAASDQKIGVSVLDSAGVLKVLLASDGASVRGVQSSTNKASTALSFKAATSQLAEQIKTDKELSDKIASNTSFNARGGGILIKVNNEIIGAIGVGGAHTDEDCALAGLKEIQSRLQ